MRQYRNNHKRKFRSNGDRNFNRNLDSQSLASNTNFQRKPHRINNQNPSRLIEKYNNLAREALSTGDKILSESYYQFSDHYLRVLKEKEKNPSDDILSDLATLDFEDENNVTRTIDYWSADVAAKYFSKISFSINSLSFFFVSRCSLSQLIVNFIY